MSCEKLPRGFCQRRRERMFPIAIVDRNTHRNGLNDDAKPARFLSKPRDEHCKPIIRQDISRKAQRGIVVSRRVALID
jgi:hypothetical protein